MPSTSPRRGSIIIVVVMLVAALVLIATLFLVEVHGQSASSRSYLRTNLARFAADAGIAHAQAVLDYQMRAEAGSKHASTTRSPSYRAFAPLTSEGHTMPGEGDDAWVKQLPGEVALLQNDNGLTSKLGAQPTRLRDPHKSWRRNNRFSRFITHAYYDQDLQPTTDVSKAFYQGRYDVLILNIDPLHSLRPDFGADEYREPADSEVFGFQPSTLLGSIGSAVTGAELDHRRSMREQYRHMFGRSITSMVAAHPETNWDGTSGESIWEEVVVTVETDPITGVVDTTIRVPRGTRSWMKNEQNSGWGFSRMVHVNQDPVYGISGAFSRNGYDATKDARHTYTQDAARHIADVFHGVGITRVRNTGVMMYPAADRQHTFPLPFNESDGTIYAERVTGPYYHKWHRPGFYAGPGERPYSPRMAWTQYLNSTNSAFATEAAQHPPFASGIVDRDPAVDAETMDVGGVPWEINPLTAPRDTLMRMVLGLSPQLLAASGNKGGNGSLRTVGMRYAPAGMSNKPHRTKKFRGAKITGYDLGGSVSPGNRQLELLYDPARPMGDEHSFAAGFSGRFPDTSDREMAFAGLNPFYDPAKTIPDTVTHHPHSQETSAQLFDYLDGLRAADGSSLGAMEPRARFLNRARYIRWLSWKHELASSSPAIEQRLNELDLPITYEEGLRYYRRPDRRDLTMDIDPDRSRREYFDGTARYQGVEIRETLSGDTGVTGPVDMTIPRPSRADGTPRYRIYPHTYPGAMWTGREGRWDEGAGDWTCPHTGRSGVGVGTSEANYSRGSGAAKDRVKSIFGYELRPNSGRLRHNDSSGKREWATDAFAWDVAIAAYESLATNRSAAAAQYDGGAVTVRIEDIDRRMVDTLALHGGAPYSFGANVPVLELYNPIEPIDVDGDGLWEPATDDTMQLDIDGDGTLETVPAIRDAEYIYLQYNRYWPVADQAIPNPILDPARPVRPFDEVRDEVNGLVASSIVTDWKLGSDPAELETFTGDDFYYHHPRNLVLASMMLNDVRQSLMGAGRPQTIADFAPLMATHLPGVGQMDITGLAARQVFIAGRNQDPSTGVARPFSRTGRLVIKPDRFFRILVRGQMINLTLSGSDRRQDNTELFVDAIYCSDPNEDGDPTDGRILFRGEKGSSKKSR